MKKLLIIVLLSISIPTFGQQTKEIGIDLYTSGYELIFTNPQNWITLRLNYKKHKNEIVQRWHFEASSGSVWNYTIFDTIVLKVGTGSILYYVNYTRILNKCGLYYGIEKKRIIGKGEFYYGGDIGVKLFRVISGPKWSPMLGNNYPGAEQFPDDKKTADIGFVITPFTGVRFPISKKIWFNVELGAEVNYMITNRPYYRGDGHWEDAGKQYFDFPALNKLFINNIGFSYRF
jgi:hypothetical protein